MVIDEIDGSAGGDMVREGFVYVMNVADIESSPFRVSFGACAT